MPPEQAGHHSGANETEALLPRPDDEISMSTARVAPDADVSPADAHEGRTVANESPAPSTTTSTTRRIGRNIVAIVSAEVLGKCATLVFTVVLARKLTAEQFGSFSYALAFGLLLAILITFAFDTHVLRRGSADRADLNIALREALILQTVHAVPIVLIGGFVGALTRPDPSSAIALVLVLLATVLDGYGDLGRAAATACEEPGRASFALVLQRVAACIFAIVALEAGGSLVAVSAAYLLSSLVGQAVLLVVLRRMGVRPQFRGADRVLVVKMWRGTIFLGFNTVAEMALFRIDALMLGAYAGDAVLASYAVAYRLIETVLFVCWAATRALIPSMVRAGAGSALMRVGEQVLAVSWVFLIPYAALLWLDGPDLLRLIFGGQYGTESFVSLQLLALAPVTFALSHCVAYLMFVRGYNATLLITTIATAAINVGLNLWLIPAHGAQGAALATTLSYAIHGVLGVIVMLPRNGFLRLDRALVLPVCATVPLVAVLWVMHLPVLLEIGISGLVYVLCYAALVRWLDPKQLELILSLLRRG